MVKAQLPLWFLMQPMTFADVDTLSFKIAMEVEGDSTDNLLLDMLGEA